MARYIKANYKVAQYLKVQNIRNRTKDGHYLLWQADILPLGRLTQLSSIMERVGAIALLPNEAREEQDGTVIRPLPVALDPAFVIESKPSEEAQPEVQLEEDPSTEVQPNTEEE